ncbi:MAG: type II secretion system protein [Verrucomicrobia bacterium]|nr:type II secretion system protein [Verrucomicrobiota bacterium]
MKISTTSPGAGPAAPQRSEGGFTMIEIAICLAIIGVALVGIIGVLPYGMSTQRDNRQETIIGQDASLLTELIRNGARGADDLTNYVYRINNTVTTFNDVGVATATHVYDYNSASSTLDGAPISHLADLNTGMKIIGFLSTPEFVDTNLNATTNLYSGGYSNHVVAYVRSISGLAVEKPPQENQLMRDDTFTYRLFIVNAPVWPQLPNGNLGAQHMTFRASVAGQVTHIYTNSLIDLYFYQPQYFSASP